MPQAATQSSVPVAASRSPSSPDGAERHWGLIALTGVAVVLVVLSLFDDWLVVRVDVTPVAAYQNRHGIGYFGALGIGYGIGVLLLVGLVGSALWRPSWLPGRWRTGLAWAALGVGLLTLADLGLALRGFFAAEPRAAATVVRLRNSIDTLPSAAEFQVSGPGLYTGLTATVLLVLAVVQLLRPGWTTQAVVGAALAVGATVVPWYQVWTIDDTISDVPFQVRTVWLWSHGSGVLLIGELLLLLIVVAACLRAPGYGRARWAVGAAVLAGLIFFGTQMFGDDIRLEAFDLRRQVAEVLEASSTGAGVLLALSVILPAVAAARAWWHGREEVYAPTSDDGWLPKRLRGTL